MAIQKELWIPAIEENLYRGIEVIASVATDDSAYVNNKTIHVPNAGTAPSVSRGNSTYPVAIEERTDADVEYTLTNFEIGPIRIGWADQLQLSYDKVQSVTNDFMGNLSEALRNYLLAQFMNTATAANTVSTTGTSTTTNWLGGDATGSLKHLIGADVRSAAAKLDGQKFPYGDRYLLLDYMQFWQLIGDVTYNDARIGHVGGFPVTLDNIFGFTVIQLPYVGALSTNSTGGTVISPTAADGSYSFAAANRPTALAFHKRAVSWGKTGVEAFSQEQDPTMFGDILSASVYAGGKYRRSSADGIVMIRSTAG
jgi:hypothetical protein